MNTSWDNMLNSINKSFYETKNLIDRKYQSNTKLLQSLQHELTQIYSISTSTQHNIKLLHNNLIKLKSLLKEKQYKELRNSNNQKVYRSHHGGGFLDSFRNLLIPQKTLNVDDHLDLCKLLYSNFISDSKKQIYEITTNFNNLLRIIQNIPKKLPYINNNENDNDKSRPNTI